MSFQSPTKRELCLKTTEEPSSLGTETDLSRQWTGTSRYHHLRNVPATFFCFFSLVACSFKEKEKKPRNFEVAWLIVLGFFGCFDYPLFGVGIKSPIDLFIGQGAVYSSVPITIPQSSRILRLASSRSVGTTSNTPSKVYCVRTL